MKQEPENQIIGSAIAYVKTTLQHAEAGHDWWHIERVYRTAKVIAADMNANLLVVELAALLHDIADAKFHDGDEKIGVETAKRFMINQGVNPVIISEVLFIVQHLSFKNSFDFDKPKSIEFQIVQDADRLDAIGAIGIARAFSYGGFKGRPFYDPDIKPLIFTDPAQYKNSKAPTINHFYEKLLLLKDQLNTPKAKEIAEKRHAFMLLFLQNFFEEWVEE
jgi:uncharacterized protein